MASLPAGTNPSAGLKEEDVDGDVLTLSSGILNLPVADRLGGCGLRRIRGEVAVAVPVSPLAIVDDESDQLADKLLLIPVEVIARRCCLPERP